MLLKGELEPMKQNRSLGMILMMMIGMVCMSLSVCLCTVCPNLMLLYGVIGFAGYEQHKHGMEVFQLYRQMQQEGLQPVPIIFSCSKSMFYDGNPRYGQTNMWGF